MMEWDIEELTSSVLHVRNQGRFTENVTGSVWFVRNQGYFTEKVTSSVWFVRNQGRFTDRTAILLNKQNVAPRSRACRQLRALWPSSPLAHCPAAAGGPSGGGARVLPLTQQSHQ